MKTLSKYAALRVCFAILVLLSASACDGRRNESPVLPPETTPLSQSHVGYGVINILYTRLGTDTTVDGPAVGHARVGTVVRIHERRLVREGGRNESWLLIEGEDTGWIREDFVNVYANLSQARAAANAMR